MGEDRKYDKKDAAKDTDSTTSEVSRAWHDAREDAQEAGELPERAASKAQRTMQLSGGRGYVHYTEEDGMSRCTEIMWDGNLLDSMEVCNGIHDRESHETWEIQVGGAYEADVAFPPNHHLK